MDIYIEILDAFLEMLISESQCIMTNKPAFSL
jgi:hypothetical protein